LGVSRQRNPLIASFASKTMIYRGLGSGIIRVMNENIKVDFVNEESANQFKTIIWRINQNDIKDVSIAILESSGKLSVIPENTKTPVTKIMFNKCCTDIPFPITVISDGKILKQGLKKSNLSAHEIKKLLKAQNIASEKRVFYMTVADKQIQTLIKKDPRL
jgi:uncharacterized membrane protein YcaP (DUF421 family)